MRRTSPPLALLRSVRLAGCVALALAGCKGTKDAPVDSDPPVDTAPCEAPTPPADAVVRLGASGDETLLPNGRRITPVGTLVDLGGMPSDVVFGASGRFAYVTNTERYERYLQVVDTTTGEIVQRVDRNDAWVGLAASADGRRLYASEGRGQRVDVYDLGDDGLVTEETSIPVDGFPAGLALSEDGGTLYVALYQGDALGVIDLATLTLTTTIPLDSAPYALTVVPGRAEVYAAGLSTSAITVTDTELGAQVASIEADSDPSSVVAAPDGSTVWATLSNSDSLVAIDTDSRSIVATAVLTGDWNADGSDPLPSTGPTDVALDPVGDRLFVTRAGDNSVSLFDATTLAELGSLPVAWYPDAVDFRVGPDGVGRIAVTNARGFGTGPNRDDTEPSVLIHGNLSVVDVGAESMDPADLAAGTVTVRDNLRRTEDIYPFTCDTWFPIPTDGAPSPVITHIVLIVKENKTFDSVLGDLEGSEGRPDLAIFGEDITPNLHALARQYTVGDNFYTDSEVSTQGHLWLTSNFVNEFMERSWLEDYHGAGGFADDAVKAPALPSYGTFFTHLLRNQVDFSIFGEVVGTLDECDEGAVINHVDFGFPGIFFDTSIKDADKAEYVAEQLVDNAIFPPFVYVLLPNDHTNGTGSGAQTPESMINDNDVGMGILIDRLSRSPEWAHTAVFVVEDDPQQGADHIDAHRSFVIVASPYAKSGHVSTVLTSFPSLFRTFEQILGIGPMNRYDAVATPLYDAFQGTPDLTPYTHIDRTVPDGTNGPSAPGSEESEDMDFSGPDRNPHLGEVLWWERTGVRPASLAEAREGDEDSEETDGDADDEIYEQTYAAWEARLAADPALAARVHWKRPSRQPWKDR